MSGLDEYEIGEKIAEGGVATIIVIPVVQNILGMTSSE